MNIIYRQTFIKLYIQETVSSLGIYVYKEGKRKYIQLNIHNNIKTTESQVDNQKDDITESSRNSAETRMVIFSAKQTNATVAN